MTCSQDRAGLEFKKHAAGAIIGPAAISDRKAGIPLNDLLAQQGPLARFPERCRVDDPVTKRPAIGTIAARDRAWNADELGPHLIAGEPYRGIAVTAHIHEFKVRGKCRVGNGASALQVETFGVFETRADAVLEEHVVSPFGLTLCLITWGPVGQEQRTERMILAKTVLICLHRPGAGERGADETDPDRLELRGRQQGGRVPGPETVTVARHDRKSGDLRIPDEVIDFATPICAKVSAGHFCLVSPSGRFCGSARKSRAPCELPQIFQVAADRRSCSMNHFF